MDKLSDLPVKDDIVKTAEESEIMNSLFPPSQDAVPVKKTNSNVSSENVSFKDSFTTKTSKINWKLIGLSSFLFMAMANPWIDKLFCNLPYCGDNIMYLLILKVLIFVIVMVMISMFF